MKKISLYLVSAMLLLGTTATTLQAGEATLTNNPTSMPATKPIESMEVSSLVARIYEINAMDKTEMTRSEKHALRSEVKSINRELNNRGNGLYISVGAAIIIVLLIIILL